jgi:hypothetical protein
MYLRIILLVSAIFNLGIILKSIEHWCCDGGEYFNQILILSFGLVIFSFINLILYFVENSKSNRK